MMRKPALILTILVSAGILHASPSENPDKARNVLYTLDQTKNNFSGMYGKDNHVARDEQNGVTAVLSPDGSMVSFIIPSKAISNKDIFVKKGNTLGLTHGFGFGKVQFNTIALCKDTDRETACFELRSNNNIFRLLFKINKNGMMQVEWKKR
jgi:hypothetical protein